LAPIIFLLPGQIISARQRVKPEKRRLLPFPDSSGVINPSPGIATKIDGRNGRGHSIHFLEIQPFYRR